MKYNLSKEAYIDITWKACLLTPKTFEIIPPYKNAVEITAPLCNNWSMPFPLGCNMKVHSC